MLTAILDRVLYEEKWLRLGRTKREEIPSGGRVRAAVPMMAGSKL